MPDHTLSSFQDDGLPIPEVGPWATEKHRRMALYCRLFSTGMKKSWNHRVYVDLFAGAGLARIEGTGEIIPGSPLIALRVPDPFDAYIFCEEDPDKLATLRTRVERIVPSANVVYVEGDVNKTVDEVVEKIPRRRRGESVLSLCFSDPYRLQPLFKTVRRLVEQRSPLDVLSVLTLGHDANRNKALYLQPGNDTIDGFLGDPDWRNEWIEAERMGENFMYFLARKYAAAMEGIGYLPTRPEAMYPVRLPEKNVLLYYLALFSGHDLAYTFWKEVLKYASPQLLLRLEGL